MTENIPPRNSIPLFEVEATRIRFTGREKWRFEFFQDHALLKSRRDNVVIRFPNRTAGISHEFASTFFAGFNFEIKTPDRALRFQVPDRGIKELKRFAETAEAEMESSAPVAETAEAEMESSAPVAKMAEAESGASESSAPLPPALPTDDSAGPESDPVEHAAVDAASQRTAMCRDLRGWGWGLLFIGVLSLILQEFLDPIWGGLLIAAAITTFFIKHRGMFIVLGIALLSAAVMNILSGLPGWIAFGLLQAYWAVQEFRKFPKYATVNAASAELAGEPAEREPTLSRLGIASFVMSAATIAVILCAFLGVVLHVAFLGISGGDLPGKAGPVPVLAVVLVLSCLFLPVVGTGLGLASIFQKRRRRTFGVIGLVLNTVILAILIAAIVLMPPPPEQGKGGGARTNTKQNAPAATDKPRGRAREQYQRAAAGSRGRRPRRRRIAPPGDDARSVDRRGVQPARNMADGRRIPDRAGALAAAVQEGDCQSEETLEEVQERGYVH